MPVRRYRWPEKRRANPIRFVLLTQTDQRDGGYRLS